MKEIKIWETSFNQEDVVGCMDDKLRKKFEKLPVKKQEELIERYSRSIGKMLEAGLMDDWTSIMGTAVTFSGIEEAIEEQSSTVKSK